MLTSNAEETGHDYGVAWSFVEHREVSATHQSLSFSIPLALYRHPCSNVSRSFPFFCFFFPPIVSCVKRTLASHLPPPLLIRMFILLTSCNKEFASHIIARNENNFRTRIFHPRAEKMYVFDGRTHRARDVKLVELIISIWMRMVLTWNREEQS